MCVLLLRQFRNSSGGAVSEYSGDTGCRVVYPEDKAAIPAGSILNGPEDIRNLKPSGVLHLGTPELDRRKTEEILDIYVGKGKMIVCSGCAISPDTPDENIRAMVDQVRSWEKQKSDQ